MAEIKHEYPNPDPRIGFQTFLIPDDTDCGTGYLAWWTRRGVLIPSTPIFYSTAYYKPHVMLVVTTNAAAGWVSAGLGAVDGNPNADAIATYRLPADLDPLKRHDFVVTFEGWAITGLTLDGKPLDLQQAQAND